MQEEPTTSVWHDAKDTPVASKTKIVLYTNGKWDMFKAYENKDDYDNYCAGRDHFPTHYVVKFETFKIPHVYMRWDIEEYCDLINPK